MSHPIGPESMDTSGPVAAAWRDWLAALEQAGETIGAAQLPAGDVDHAEGVRYLSRLATTALWMFVEHEDPLFPELYANTDEHKKFGVDNPDNVYLRCALDPAHAYRLWGTRGEAPYFGIAVTGAFYGSGGGRRGTLAQHQVDEFAIGSSGHFEVVLSREERPGSWIPLDPDAAGLLLRQTFDDRRTQRPAELHIERIGASGPPPPLEPDVVAARLRRAAAFVQTCARLFVKMAAGWKRAPNRLAGASGESTRDLAGDPDIHYVSGWWKLDLDEALVIDVRPAERFLYWGFQLCNVWLESLDYRNHRVATNHHLADTEADGGARLVVARRDPGVPNWIETAGHTEGAMCFRWLLAGDDPPVPEARVVPIASLQDGR